jgi:hypothetical protein
MTDLLSMMTDWKVGDQLRTVTPHTVDEDDDGVDRCVVEGDLAEVIGLERYAAGDIYHVGVPASGATGFYMVDELDHNFVRIGHKAPPPAMTPTTDIREALSEYLEVNPAASDYDVERLLHQFVKVAPEQAAKLLAEYLRP